jgi:hypothetical protein
METTLRNCTKCGEAKEPTAFHLAGSGRRRPDCKSCRLNQTRGQALSWWQANKERAHAIKRKHVLKTQYGMTPAEHDLLLASQGGVCAICGASESTVRNGKVQRLTVDHDHQTGVVRGLLCNRCNRALGLFGDDPIVMRRALSYVNKSRALTAQGGQ